MTRPRTPAGEGRSSARDPLSLALDPTASVLNIDHEHAAIYIGLHAATALFSAVLTLLCA